MTGPTPGQVAAFRLRRHHLAERAPASRLVDVAADVCGVQAQLASAAELALQVRLEGLRPADLSAELYDTRRLVKTWTMRGTLHLVPAEELPVYVHARRPAAAAYNQQWLTRAAIDGDGAEALTAAIVEGLDAGPLTRRELAQQVVPRLGEWSRPFVEHSWGGVIKRAALMGLVCFGPPRGRETTFVRVADWLGPLPELSEEEAGRLLLARYLAAYGPATLSDFARWASLPAVTARAFRRLLGEEIVELPGGGSQPRLLLRRDLEALTAEAPRDVVRLLPNFDPLLLGHVDKGHLVEPEHYKRVFRQAGWISPVVLLEGRVAGVWSHARRGGRLEVKVEPFRPLDRRPVEMEATRLARYLGPELRLEWAQPA